VLFVETEIRLQAWTYSAVIFWSEAMSVHPRYRQERAAHIKSEVLPGLYLAHRMRTQADITTVFFVGLLSVALFLGFVLANPVLVEAQTTNQSSGAENASVVIDANNSTREEIILKTVTLPDNGYIVAQGTDQLMDSDGVIDHTEYVRHGTFHDVVLRFDEPIQKNRTVWVTIHNDTNGNQEFDFGDNQSVDPPYQRNGTPISDSVQIGANRTQNKSQASTARSNNTTTETTTPVTESTEVTPTETRSLRTSSQNSPQPTGTPPASTRPTTPENRSGSVNNSSVGAKSSTETSTEASTEAGVGGGSKSEGSGGSGFGFPFLPVIFIGVVVAGGTGAYLWARRRSAALSAAASSEDGASGTSPVGESIGDVELAGDSESTQPDSSTDETSTIFDRLRGRATMLFNPYTVDLRAYGLTENDDSLTVDINEETASVWDQLQRIHELRQLPLELEDGTLQNDQQLPQHGSIRIQVEDMKRVEQRAESGVALAQETISLLKDVLQFNSNK
jgi:hypothetical protein